jgi:glycogen debranching enzyme
VACAPQAWSAATIFLLLQACLGLTISAPENRLRFDYPLLPPFLKEVHIRNLTVGDAAISVRLVRYGNDVGINVLRREGTIQVTMVK